MSLSLRTKVTLFVVGTVVSIGIVNTFLHLYADRAASENQLITRGTTFAEALSKTINTGLAAENLNFIKEFSEIVHTKDVTLAQVYSTLWLPLYAQPPDMLEKPASQGAKEHFQIGFTPYIEKYIDRFDFYVPVFSHAFDFSTVVPEKWKRYHIGYIKLSLTTDEMEKSINRLVTRDLIVTAFITVLAIIFINSFIRRNVLTPIIALQKSVMQQKKGEFPIEGITLASDDEIGRLALEFSHMSQAIREREQSLYEEKEMLNITLRSIGDGVITTDTNGQVTLINREAEIMTGMTSAEAEGRPLEDVFHILSENTMRKCENRVEKVLSTKSIVAPESHTVLISKDGTRRIIADSSAPIRDADGKNVGVVLVFRDITESKMAEEEREKLITELKDALANIKTLSGMLPICSYCKKIRDDKGYWEGVETYISKHTDTVLSHGACPECAEKAMNEFEEFKKKQGH